MKKNTRKCPNCGATVSADAKYCRKCNAILDTGRVGTLPRNNRAGRNGDSLGDLPKPVRPTEELEHPTAAGSGFFTPDRGRGDGRMTPERQERVAPDGRQRPVQTARGGPAYNDRAGRSDRRMWQIAAVLAIILVIIVVAIVLVIKLNQRPEGQSMAPSPEFEVTATNTPAPSNTPTPTIIPAVPTNTPLSNVVIATPPSMATPSPIPSPSSSPLPYTIQDVNETVYLTGVGVNIRKGPGTDFDVIGSASTGQYYTRTGRVSNGWSRISYNGGDAYVNDSFLSTAQPTASPVPNFNVTGATGTVTVSSEANLRKGPGTNYDSIGTVAAGTQLTRTGYTDSWTRVQYNGSEYFIYTSLVSDGSGGGNNNTSTTGTGTVTGNMVNVRSGPGTGYGVIGSYNYGASVTITGESSGWYQISYNGQTGYISSQYVTKN